MSTLSKFQIQALQRSLIRTAGTLSRIALIRGLYTKYGKVMTQCADDCKRREEQHASERNTALLNVDVSGHIVKPIWWTKLTKCNDNSTAYKSERIRYSSQFNVLLRLTCQTNFTKMQTYQVITMICQFVCVYCFRFGNVSRQTIKLTSTRSIMN